MDEAEAQRQIQQMVNFILNEARDKAQEIEAKSLEDFNIEKLKIVQQMKDKARQDYQRKAKQLETQRAIARSTAINKARLKKIAARQKVIEQVTESAKRHVVGISDKAADYRALLVDLMCQAMLALLEDAVYVRCRAADKDAVKQAIPEAEAKYTKFIRDACGVEKKVSIKVDEEHFLLPAPDASASGHGCLGGVVVTSMNRKIKLDNTLDARLTLVVEECLPEIRGILFPSK